MYEFGKNANSTEYEQLKNQIFSSLSVRFVWRRSGFAFFGAPILVGAPFFIFSEGDKHGNSQIFRRHPGTFHDDHRPCRVQKRREYRHPAGNQVRRRIGATRKRIGGSQANLL